MAILLITPKNVVPEKHMSLNIDPILKAAHKYCEYCGYNSYLMVVDLQRERGLFIINPWDIPLMVELAYRENNGGWERRYA